MRDIYLQNRETSKLYLFCITFVFVLIFGLYPKVTLYAQECTRGIGVYPGNVKEDFSPILLIDNSTYRNLALLRPVYQSSSYDYNLTAQLLTDGIKDTVMPEWIIASCSEYGNLIKKEREYFFDHNPMSSITLNGSKVWMIFGTNGNTLKTGIDNINISGNLSINDLDAKGWECIVFGSDDTISWEEIGRINGKGFPGEMFPETYRSWMPKDLRSYNYSINIQKSSSHKFYKVELNSLNSKSWRVAEVSVFNHNKKVEIGGPYNFTSAWKSLGNKDEWVYVDLGASCYFDQINIYWIRRALDGSIQVSEDAANWINIKTYTNGKGLIDKFNFGQAVKGRYVRLLMNQPASSDGYILSEIEVFGRGGLVASPKPSPPIGNDGKMFLSGGSWKVQRESLVKVNGEELSIPGFRDNDWVVATVPGTVLVSYLNAGAIPDPNFSNNQTLISDSYFYSDFWYRTEFVPPVSFKGKHVFLNFDGINWKANIFLNGKKLGRIEGAFMRGKFDVSNLLIPGLRNSLAVCIEKNDKPGYVTEQSKMTPDKNGGELGADNPTFHASVGWDWIPTIRGRNAGIWNNVYLTANGQVTIDNPFIKSDIPLPDTTVANISLEVLLVNHDSTALSGKLAGKFGNIVFEQSVSLKALETKIVKVDTSANPALKIHNPKLWWPCGYGEQNLYPVELKFITNDNLVSDDKLIKTGIRKMTYSEEGGVLKIWINGKRFIGRGGNWGFPESMLQYRSREYDIAVRYHKEMNFTMIRNWVGQTGNDEFYDACDKYGIMIWQDFWLANPFDGPDPDDNKMFINNVEDYVKRIRNHPSLALYCGRNEGNPPLIIDTSIRKILSINHPEIKYISNSASGIVSGGGPYRAMPVSFYFKERATTKLHSELGMPNIVNYESLKNMMPDSSMWPQNDMWGLHDFCQDGAQKGSTFNQMIIESFGLVDKIKEWLCLAQWINYEGYRAMFEAQGKNRMGMLLWMSHPAWPSLVWQTYDYYFEPTAAYFGCKKASEPLHIQWNAYTDSIEVVNYSSGEGTGLTANMQVLNFDGSVKWERDTALDCREDNIVRCFKMQYPTGLANIYFIRLKLMKGDKIISENFYCRGLENGNGKAIREMPKVKLVQETSMEQKDNRWYLLTTLTNSTKYPALMVRLKVIREKTGDLILPVIYSDNYISLMPGEKRTVKIEVENADTRGEKPAVIAEGINISK